MSYRKKEYLPYICSTHLMVSGTDIGYSLCLFSPPSFLGYSSFVLYHLSLVSVLFHLNPGMQSFLTGEEFPYIYRKEPVQTLDLFINHVEAESQLALTRPFLYSANLALDQGQLQCGTGVHICCNAVRICPLCSQLVSPNLQVLNILACTL